MPTQHSDSAPDVVLIAGPTASGKTAAALALAEALGAVIVNADSMQVYAELRVLSARPGAADEARAPHRLFGHVSAASHYSAGAYIAEAAAAIGQARAAGRPVILCGGTGLYFSALTEGLADIPAVPAPIREAVRDQRERQGVVPFYEALVARDPSSAILNPTDTQRTLRAAEVLQATGRPLSFWKTQKGPAVLDGLLLARFVLAPARAELYARIDARFAAMAGQGGLEEARALAGLDPALPASKALGLRPLQQAVRGEIGLGEAIEAGQLASRHYAKRQLTWFRHRMTHWSWVTDGRNILTNLTAKSA